MDYEMAWSEFSQAWKGPMLMRHGIELSLKFKTADVLRTVKANREKHLADYKIAVEEFQKDLVELLEKKLAAAKAGKPVLLRIQLNQPMEFSKAYDQAIAMLEATTQEEVELNGELFSQLMRDQWDWKEQFENNTAMYVNKRVTKVVTETDAV